MKLLWNFHLARDRELVYAAGFVERLRFFGFNVRKTFVGVMVTDTTPGRVVIASDVPRTRTLHLETSTVRRPGGRNGEDDA